MKTPRTVAVVALPTLALILSACSFSLGNAGPAEPTAEPSFPTETETASAPDTSTAGEMTADPEGIETSTADQLEQQVGTRPDIDCGDEQVKVAVGESITCALSVPGDTAVFDVEVTFTEIVGETFSFDYAVAPTPRP